MAQDNNRVIVSGRVSEPLKFDHELHGEEFYTMYMEVPRLSGAIDLLPLTVARGLMDEFPEPGDHITVRGQLRSYNKYIDHTNRLIITVFAKQFRVEEESMRDYINDIALTGYVCKPVAYRTTPFMREIADVLIAVNRAYGKSDYLPCIAWGRNARLAGSMSVGQLIRLEGRIQSRVYQKQTDDGELIERTAYEVSASFIESINEVGRFHGNML